MQETWWAASVGLSRATFGQSASFSMINGAYASWALFDMPIDSKLRGCDIVKMKIGDIVTSGTMRNRASIMKQKT